MTPDVEAVVDQFASLYYHSYARTWTDTWWRGVATWKCPLDLWVYQEVLHELKPDLIVETGTAHGGSAYYLASICEMLGRGEILTIDIEAKPDRPEHPRIEYLLAGSTSEQALDRVRARVAAAETVLVILDSDHSRDHVLDELRAYAPFVTPGSFLVVEDTNVNGHPVYPEHGPGPMEALIDFLAESDEFVVDESREKFFLTFNPQGFLKKVPPGSGIAAPSAPARAVLAGPPAPAVPEPVAVPGSGLTPLDPAATGWRAGVLTRLDAVLARRGLALARRG